MIEIIDTTNNNNLINNDHLTNTTTITIETTIVKEQQTMDNKQVNGVGDVVDKLENEILLLNVKEEQQQKEKEKDEEEEEENKRQEAKDQKSNDSSDCQTNISTTTQSSQEKPSQADDDVTNINNPCDLTILTNMQRFQRSQLFQALRPPILRENINGFPKLNDLSHKEFMWLEQVLKWSHHDTDIVYKLCRMGIPPRIRGFIWRLSSGSIDMERKNIGVYQHLLTKSADDYEYKISKDIARTFPKTDQFVKEEAQVSLFNILKGYAVLDPEIGYVQGMSFSAAVLMSEMDEVETFWTFTCIMKNYRLSTLFSNDLCLLRQYLYVIDRLIETTMPRLFSHFKEIGVTPVLFASEWISTLFTYNFNIDSSKRLWDVFFLHFDGRYYLHRIVLAILKINEKHLQSLDFEECVDFLKKVGYNINIELLLQVSDSISIPMKSIIIFEEEFNCPIAPPSDYF